MAIQAYSRLEETLNNSNNQLIDQDEELEAAFESEPEEDDQIHDEKIRNHPNSNDDQEDDDDDDESTNLFGHKNVSSSQEHHPLIASSSQPIKNDNFKHRQPSLIRAYDFERDPYRPDLLNQTTTPTMTTTTTTPPSLPTYNHHQPQQQQTQTQPQPHARLVGMGGGIQNDGVFANLSAKPDGGPRLNPTTGQLEYVGGNDDGGPSDKEEILPTYDSAAMDSAPPYWETTVTLPGGSGAYGILGPDDVLVDGLPVGNLFGFAWNLLVSMSFQFIGFLLTYLLHTTHSAKNGSRAGLGITLIQYGLYTRTRATELATGSGSGSGSRNGTSSFPETTTDPWGLFGSTSSRNDWDGTSSVGRVSTGANEMPYDGTMTGEQIHISSVANEWLSYMLIAIGWFLLLGGLVNYWRAVRWARAVRSEETFVNTLA